MPVPLIVLASTSRYKRDLLERLRIPFEVHSPQIDEAALPSETPRDTALRLAREKATSGAVRFAGAIVIGADQTVDLGGRALGKPLSHEAALLQLQSLQGHTAVFYTAVSVVGPAANHVQVECVPTTVTFRNLPAEQLEAYLRSDQPYDCAGAAKVESLGIALVTSAASDDPTALIGLPLICLTSMLASAGVNVLQSQ